MPSISIEAPDLLKNGPRLNIQLAPSKPVIDYYLKNQKQPPNPINCIALIDTGAGITVIKQGLPANLTLQPRGILKIATPSCPQFQCNTYDVSIFFPVSKVVVPLVNVAEAPLAGAIDCLIGRDLLRNFLFIYEGYSNRFILSF